MRLVPLKSGDEMVREYEARLMREACTRRAHVLAIAVAVLIGWWIAYGPTTMETLIGNGADPNMSPRQAQDSGETVTYEP